MWTLILFFFFLITVEGQRVPQPTVSKIASGNFTNNPFYYDDLKVLLFCDVNRKTVNAFNSVTKTLHTITTDRTPSFILPIKGTTDKFILSLGPDLVVLSWNFTADSAYYTCLVTSTESYSPGNVWTSGLASPSGKVLGGTRGSLIPGGVVPGQGTLYLVDTTLLGEASVNAKLTNQDSVRSFAFTVNYTVGFYTNRSDTVYQFTYDVISSNISKVTPIFNFTNYNLSCVPDGLVTDIYNNLWVAGYGCGQVYKFNTTTLGIDQAVNIPQAPYLSDVIFGGINKDELFVTSLNINSTSPKKNGGPGSVFKVQNLGVQGFRDNLVVMKSDCTPVYNVTSVQTSQSQTS